MDTMARCYRITAKESTLENPLKRLCGGWPAASPLLAFETKLRVTRASIQIQDGGRILVVPAPQQGRLCCSSGTAGGTLPPTHISSCWEFLSIQNSSKTPFDLAEVSSLEKSRGSFAFPAWVALILRSWKTLQYLGGSAVDAQEGVSFSLKWLLELARIWPIKAGRLLLNFEYISLGPN